MGTKEKKPKPRKISPTRVPLPPKVKVRTKSETVETIEVAQWLRRRGILFCHVPNEGARGARESAVLSMMGTRKGVPDLLIFARPKGPGGGMAARGYAIEMKKVGAAGPTPAQDQWQRLLTGEGWATAVCYGAAEAIAYLEDWGFG